MASVSERPCGHRRVPHYCLYLSIRRQFNNFSVKHYLNKRFKYSILQCITQDSAHCRSLVEAAAVSSRNHNALSGIPPSQGDRRHGPTVTLTHRIPNVCSLSLNGILRNGEGDAVAALVALHYFYNTRAKRLAAAMQQLLDENPQLHQDLEKLSDENGLLMNISELEAKLKISSEYAISSLDSVAMLVTICKFADPNTAERVEKEIREEVATLALGDGIGEDGKDGQEQMRQLSKLVSSSKWEHWKRYLRSAIIESRKLEEECERTEDEFLNIKLHCDSRTSSDDAFLENVLEISARGPHVVEIAQKGLQASSCTPAVKSLLFLWFGDKPESSILPIIRALCWQHAKMDTETDASFLAAVATTEYGSNGENETVRFSGTVNDLRVLILTLAALESGELEVGKAWSPVDGAIRLRRIPASASWRSARLKGEKVVYEMQGLAPDQVPSSIKLSRRQANALIDCLDCLIDISPSFGLGDSKNSPSQTILG